MPVSSRAIAVSALLALAGTLSWLAFTEAAPAPSADPSVEQQDSADSGVQQATSVRVELPDTVERSRAGTPAAAAVQVPADARLVELLVVDGASGSPVAAADVTWVTEAHWTRIRELPRAKVVAYELDEGLLFDRFGWRTRSDPNGLARIAVGADGVVAFEPLPLGRTFLVAGTDEPWMASATGPTLVGQTTEHTIDVAMVAFVIGGRLVGPDGAALRATDARFEFGDERRRIAHHWRNRGDHRRRRSAPPRHRRDVEGRSLSEPAEHRTDDRDRHLQRVCDGARTRSAG